jgi:hypothetical protein
LTAAQEYRPTRLHDFFGRGSYHLFIAHMPTAAILATGLHVPTNSASIYGTTIFRPRL